MKNIAFAKIGKSIKFRPSKWSPTGGDNEPAAMLKALANHNPDKTFYIVGKNDFSTLSDNEQAEVFPYGNVIDIWKGVKNTKDDAYYCHIINYFNARDISLDYGIMMIGQIGTVTVPGKIEQVRNRDLIASVIDMTKGYTTPLTVWLNETKIPYLEIINDPRYKMNQARDMFHLPETSLSQYDFSYEASVIQSYENQDKVTKTLDAKYAGMEKAFCIDYDYPQEVNTDRSSKFMIVLNEGKPSRYPFLKEWVLDHMDGVEVYGAWDDERTKDDERFCGPLKMDKLQEKLKNVKSTFIIPIAPGWVTSKYIEMIHAGVVPFLHPTYDEQGHTNIPEFFRPKTPEELQQRVDIVEKNYEEIITQLRKLILKPNLYDGQYINQMIMTAIDPSYVEPNKVDYKKREISTLDAFF